jgi:hypothetical protein
VNEHKPSCNRGRCYGHPEGESCECSFRPCDCKPAPAPEPRCCKGTWTDDRMFSHLSSCGTAEPAPGPGGEITPWTLCVECGYDVQVDEDGCCVTCGNGALQLKERDPRTEIAECSAEITVWRGRTADHASTVAVLRAEVERLAQWGAAEQGAHLSWKASAHAALAERVKTLEKERALRNHTCPGCLAKALDKTL